MSKPNEIETKYWRCVNIEGLYPGGEDTPILNAVYEGREVRIHEKVHIRVAVKKGQSWSPSRFEPWELRAGDWLKHVSGAEHCYDGSDPVVTAEAVKQGFMSPILGRAPKTGTGGPIANVKTAFPNEYPYAKKDATGPVGAVGPAGHPDPVGPAGPDWGDLKAGDTVEQVKKFGWSHPERNQIQPNQVGHRGKVVIFAGDCVVLDRGARQAHDESVTIWHAVSKDFFDRYFKKVCGSAEGGVAEKPQGSGPFRCRAHNIRYGYDSSCPRCEEEKDTAKLMPGPVAMGDTVEQIKEWPKCTDAGAPNQVGLRSKVTDVDARPPRWHARIGRDHWMDREFFEEHFRRVVGPTTAEAVQIAKYEAKWDAMHYPLTTGWTNGDVRAWYTEKFPLADLVPQNQEVMRMALQTYLEAQAKR
jgi:hypothetical protein